MKNEGALRMRFSRQGGIYRSDVFSLLVNPVQMPPPVGRPRYRAIGRAGRSNTPCPSSAMSSALAIPQRVARQHCPSPLHQQCQIKSFAPSTEMLYHRPVHSLLFVCLSQGDKPTTFLRFQRHPAFRRAITLFTLGLPPFKLGARLRYSRVTVLGLLVGRQVAVNVRTGGVQGERPYSTAKIAALVAAIVLLIVLKSSH